MKRVIRIACAGRNWHSFTLLAGQIQESTDRTYGVKSDKGNWHLRRSEGVAVGTCNRAVPGVIGSWIYLANGKKTAYRSKE